MGKDNYFQILVLYYVCIEDISAGWHSAVSIFQAL